MFKKKPVVFLLVILFIALCMFPACNSKSKIILLEEPDPITYPGSYQDAINTFPSDLTVDPISDYTDAAQKGKHLWHEELGELTDDYLNWDIEVFYVPEEDTWVVKGTLPKDYVGMLPISIIQTDGTVLSVGWV